MAKSLPIAEYEDVKGDTKRRFKFIKDHPEILKYLKYLLEDGGGVYKGGGGVGKMYYHIIEYGQYDNIGYQGYYDTIEEAQKQVEKLSNFFPNQTFEIFADKSRKEPPITTMHNGGGVEEYGIKYDELIKLKKQLKDLFIRVANQYRNKHKDGSGNFGYFMRTLDEKKYMNYTVNICQMEL